MKNMGKRIVAVAMASVLAVVAVAGSAYAYFTDFVKTEGQRELVFGYSTETHEDISDDGTKTITISNTAITEAMVRVIIFGADMDDPQGLTEIVAGGNWSDPKHASDGSGYIYEYTKVLAPVGQEGSTTEPLQIKLNKPEGQSGLEEFQVIVIGQCSPVAYDDNDRPYGYIWSN